MRTGVVKHRPGTADETGVTGQRCGVRRLRGRPPARVAGLVLALAVAATLMAATTASAAPGPGEPTAPPGAVHVNLGLPAHPTAADLARVRGTVADLTATVTRLAAGVDAATSREASLRVALGRAADAREAARGRLADAVRTTYIASGGDGVVRFVAGWTPADEAAAHLAARSRLAVDDGLVRAETAAGATVDRLSAGARGYREALLRRAAPVQAAQARARDALGQAERVFAADAVALAALAEQRAALDAASARVAFAVTPAVPASGRGAAAAQAPVLALLARTPLGALPVGYRYAGTAFVGTSSWYGPGFVGNATSSGSPYDPEQLTCAMLAVPLGTVVRVTTDVGRVVTVLVTDHGPYVPGTDRIIDLSAAAARLAGVGLTRVRVDVLSPA